MQPFITATIERDIAVEIEKVRRTDLLIVRFPIWWTSMLEILKGWFHRVFARRFKVDAGTGDLVRPRASPG